MAMLYAERWNNSVGEVWGAGLIFSHFMVWFEIVFYDLNDYVDVYKSVRSSFGSSCFINSLNAEKYPLVFVVSWFSLKSTFSQNSFGNTIWIRVSNRLDPDQARRFVGPDLGLICFQMLYEDDRDL